MSIINSSVVNMPSRTDSPLQVAIIGAGLGGLAAAVSLRRQGHAVTVYERYDFAGEVGASLSAASNGSRFLEEWGVDVKAAKPVRLSNSLETKYFRSNSRS
jgi:salicylate hydroxylase